MAVSSPRAGFGGFPNAPLEWADKDQHPRLIAEVVNGSMIGRTNNTGEVTLGRSTTSTTLTDPRLAKYSVVIFVPLTEESAEFGDNHFPYIKEADMGNGSATITHEAVESDNLVFWYAIIGGNKPFGFRSTARYTRVHGSAYSSDFS